MNHNNITPEECRIAARLLRRDDFQADCGGYHAEADWFERKAGQIEREQDEKRRFTEAFHIFDQARRNYWTQPTPDDRPAYIPAAEDESYRAGVRALLAHLDGDIVAADVYGVRDNGDVLLTASDAASVKAVLRFVFGRNAGATYPTEDVEALKAYFWPELKVRF